MSAHPDPPPLPPVMPPHCSKAEHLRSRARVDEAGGPAAIDELTAGVGGIRRNAQIVREHALMRRLLSTTYEIQARLLSP